MKTLVSAVATASVLLGGDVAYAGGPDWLLNLPDEVLDRPDRALADPQSRVLLVAEALA
jgi:hypothetical protein